MAVLSRVNFIGQQRLDLHHMLAMDSYTAFDFRSIIAGIVGSNGTYVVKGLFVSGQTGLSINIRVADCLVYNPKDPNGSMYVGLPDDPDEIVVLPASQPNVYVEAIFKNQAQAPVNSGFWDALALVGDDAGGTEFTASANTQNVIVLEIKVNTTGFTEGSIPLVKASTGASSITAMEDRRPLLYRLGKGGISPDPLNKYDFASLRSEPVTSGIGTGEISVSSPWRSKDASGAINDKALTSFKDWADAVMTRISEIAGSTLWYASGAATAAVANLSLSQTFFDNDTGHSIQPSPTSSFKWTRVGTNLVLRGEGTVPLDTGAFRVGLTRWQSNYSIVEWHLGRAFLSASNRSYDTSGDGIRWTAPAPVDGGNIYLTLEREVPKGSGNNVAWKDNTSYTAYSALRAVSGVAGDFTGIANGDYIRKDSEGISKYYKVVAMSDGVTNFTDSGVNKNKVADNTIVALLLDRDIDSAASSEPLKFFRSRYSEADLVADTTPGIYNFQDSNRYWLGRRIGDYFILRNYGTMQEGEEVPTLDDSFNDGNGGASDFQILHNEIAVFNASNHYTLKTGSGTLLTIRRRKSNNTVGSPSATDNSYSLITYTIDSPVGLMNDGDSLWVRLSDEPTSTSPIALTNGNVTPSADDLANDPEGSTNRWEVRSAADSPLRNWDNRFVFRICRRITIDGEPMLLFFDGSIIGRYGKVINQDLDLRANLRLHDAPTNAVPFFSSTDAGVVKWNAAEFFWTESTNELTVRNTIFGLNDIRQVTPANFSILSNLGANTLTIGQANSTTVIPGDLIVDNTFFDLNDISQITPANFAFLSNLGANTLTIGQASSTTVIPGDLIVDNTIFDLNEIRQVTPTNFSILSNLGAHTATIGQSDSTIFIPGDLIVNGTVAAMNTDDLYVEDKLISLAVGVPLNGGFGSGIEVADDTKTSASIDTFNTQIYVDLTFSTAHGYAVGDQLGVSAIVNVGGITAGQISGEYTVVASGSAIGDAEVISSTVLRIWTKGAATSTDNSTTTPPKVFKKPFSIRLGDSSGSYSGLTSWVFRIKGVSTTPTITPVSNYGIVPTAHSVNMLQTRIPFVNNDNAGPSGVDTTFDFSSDLTWNSTTSTLNAENINTTDISTTSISTNNLLTGSVFYTNQLNVTSSYTATDDDFILRVDTTSATSDITITLPSITALNAGRMYIIKDVGGAVNQVNKRCIIAPATGDNIISGQPDPLVMDIPYFALILVNDGSNSWMVI